MRENGAPQGAPAGRHTSQRGGEKSLKIQNKIAVGSGILAWLAFRPFQFGFFILETVWAAVSIYALTKSMRAASQARA